MRDPLIIKLLDKVWNWNLKWKTKICLFVHIERRRKRQKTKKTFQRHSIYVVVHFTLIGVMLERLIRIRECTIIIALPKGTKFHENCFRQQNPQVIICSTWIGYFTCAIFTVSLPQLKINTYLASLLQDKSQDCRFECIFLERIMQESCKK